MKISVKTKKALIMLIVAVLTVICGVIIYSALEKVLYPVKYESFVEKYSADYNVDKNLVYAVIKTESSFDPDAKSNVGAIGLMQIMPDTFKWLQSKHKDKPKKPADVLYDPETNIKYGVFFLSLLKEEFGSDRLVAAAYHAGRGKVNKWLSDSSISPDGMTIEKIPSRSTGHYVDKVLANMDRYKKIYD